jgi:hypothetical protein
MINNQFSTFSYIKTQTPSIAEGGHTQTIHTTSETIASE